MQRNARALQWIPTALSTLKPTTSPHLSVVQLYFTPRTRWRVPRASIERLNNDLGLIEHEVARIGREFVGEVNVTMDRKVRLRVSVASSPIVLRFPHRILRFDPASMLNLVRLSRERWTF